jgi:hypothetical protein
MDVGGMDGIAHNWFRSSRVNLDVAPSDCFQYRSGVEGGLIESGIAVDSRDA